MRDLRAHGVLRELLEPEIEGGQDSQAGRQRVEVPGGLHTLHDARREERHHVDIVRIRRRVGETLVQGSLLDLQRDGTGVVHRIQHQLLSRGRSRGIDQRVVAGRVVGDAREHRGLRQVEPARIDPKVRVRRGLDARGAGAEVDVVEVVVKDDRPRIRAGQPLRERDLLHLVRKGPRVVEVENLRQLHGDGAGALRGAVGQVGDRGSGHPRHVDGTLRPEGAVLDGDDRLLHQRRDRGQRHGEPRGAGRVDIRDEPARAVEDQRIGREHPRTRGSRRGRRAAEREHDQHGARDRQAEHTGERPDDDPA